MSNVNYGIELKKIAKEEEIQLLAKVSERMIAFHIEE
jgi:hypothetical protein